VRVRTLSLNVASPRLLTRWGQGIDAWLFAGAHSLWAAAACRIGTGLSVLGLLIANFSSREMWVGPGSVWAEPARAVNKFPELALLRGVSGDVVTLIYALTMLAALAFVLGWHTKVANAATLIGFIAIVAQNPVVSGQGDNLVRVTLLWLLLMRTAEHWSLDDRRRRRREELSPRARRAVNGEDVLPRWLWTSVHNIGMVGLLTQTVLLYATAGLDKVSDTEWQHGTALYYTLQLPEYRPFPWLSDLLSNNSAVLAVVTYTVLLTQLFFAPLLLNAAARRIVIALAIGVNAVFGVVFATPWSSLSLIAVTCLFASSAAFQTVDDRVRHLGAPTGDWFALRWYGVLDALDAARHRLVYPVVDWIRFSVLRRP
jgi:hypothetical protein